MQGRIELPLTVLPSAFGASQPQAAGQDFRALGIGLQSAALHRSRQALDVQAQGLALEAGGLGGRLQGGGLLFQQRGKVGGVASGAGLRVQRQDKLPGLRNALFFAHQPFGVQAYLKCLRGFEALVDLHLRAQQHLVFKAMVHHGGHGNHARNWPQGGPGLHAFWQRPIQLGGQATVAGVEPVGVPARLVFQQQTQHQALTGLHALRRMRHQFGPHLRGGDDGRGHVLSMADSRPQHQAEKNSQHLKRLGQVLAQGEKCHG